MLIPILMLFLLGLGMPISMMVVGFTRSTPGWGWVAIIVVSVASIAGGVVIYIIARLQQQTKREE